MNENPYASPMPGSFAAAPLSDAEAIRKEHISHEASIKSVGILYLIGAIIIVPAGLFTVAGGIGGAAAGDAAAQGAVLAGVGFFYLLLGILQGATAIGLRKLQPWAKYVAVVFSAIGLLGIPIGTIISAYILYLLLSKKGSVVFSDQYKRVIAETPHIKYKTSIIVVIFLILLVLVLVMGVLALVLGG